MIHQLVQSSMAKDQKFYLVCMPEDGTAHVEEFDAMAQLVDRIIALLGTETALFPFMGYWFGITRGEMRYLVTPFGMLPLYRLLTPEQAEIDRSGWVGREPPVEVPQAPVSAATAAEQHAPTEPSSVLGEPDEDTPVIADANPG